MNEDMMTDDDPEPTRELRPGQTIKILFTQPPGPESCFIEVENEKRQSVNAGDWKRREDGLWELIIQLPRTEQSGANSRR